MNKRDEIAVGIRTARKKKGLSQVRAAEMLGITQSQLSMLECGKRRLSAELEAHMAEIYSVEEDTEPPAADNSVNDDLVARLGGYDQRLADGAGAYLDLVAYLLLRKMFPQLDYRLAEDKIADLERILQREPEILARLALSIRPGVDLAQLAYRYESLVTKLVK